MSTTPGPQPSPEQLRLSADELAAFLDTAEARSKLGDLVDVAPGHVRMGLEPDASMIRPGGIVSGQTLRALIDLAAYAVVLAHIGPVEMAVTNTSSVSILNACRLERVFADARPLRRRFASLDLRL